MPASPSAVLPFSAPCTAHPTAGGAAPPRPSVAELLERARTEEAHGRTRTTRDLLERALYCLGDADEAAREAAHILRWIARTYQTGAHARACDDAQSAHRHLGAALTEYRVLGMGREAAAALAGIGALHAAGDVARHFERAGCAADAFRTALEGGARAAATHAYDTAAELFTVARRHARTQSEMADVAWRLVTIAELQGRYAEAECATLLTELVDGAAALGVLRAARRMREKLRLYRSAPTKAVLASCTALLTDARDAGAADEVVSLLTLIAQAHARLGDAAQSERFALDAVAEADRLPDLALRATAAMQLGYTVMEAVPSGTRETSPADAVPHFRRALDLYTRVGDRTGQLRAHASVGIACDRSGKHAAAEVAYATSLAIAREVAARHSIGGNLINLGVLLLKTGRFAQAEESFQEARQLFTALGMEMYRLAALYNLAHLARAQGDAAGALGPVAHRCKLYT